MDAESSHSFTTEEIAERFRILRFRVLETQIGKIWRQFEEAGFEPILIKGWAAAQLYPEPFRRDFTDIDLMISPERYEAALKFREGIRENIPVDLHKGARHLDTLNFGELFSNSQIVKCGEVKIRVLSAEDHLRVLCVHWLNDGGADREKLWDIYYAVRQRPENFDWDRLLKAVTPKRRKWIVCTIGLAHKYLGLEIHDTPLAGEAETLPDWLIKAVEKEWKSNVRLKPLQFVLNDKRELWEQIKKRLPPNPIQSTVEMEGDFDEKPRLFYQIRGIYPRMMPSLKSIGKSLRAKRGKKL